MTALPSDTAVDTAQPNDPTDRFLEFRRTGDRGIRNELIAHYRWVALRCAREFAGRNENMDDLVQVAQLGVLKAVMRFDPERGYTFSTFAIPTVRGELRRHFRDATWAVHVPRAAKDRSIQLRQATQAVSQRLGRTPTVPDLAREMCVSEDEVLQAMEAAASYRTLSTDTTDGGEARESSNAGGRDERSAGARPLGEDPGVQSDLRLDTDRLLGRLPPRWQAIVRLRFYEGLTQSEIGEEVGISQVQVSRVLRQALDRMRDLMEPAS
jgi:RNA polymerase sigma-B factor